MFGGLPLKFRSHLKQSISTLSLCLSKAILSYQTGLDKLNLTLEGYF